MKSGGGWWKGKVCHFLAQVDRAGQGVCCVGVGTRMINCFGGWFVGWVGGFVWEAI